LEVAVDDFDGLEQPARRLTFPDFAEAAAADAVDQLVARNRLRTWLDPKRHNAFRDAATGRLRCRRARTGNHVCTFPILAAPNDRRTPRDRFIGGPRGRGSGWCGIG